MAQKISEEILKERLETININTDKGLGYVLYGLAVVVFIFGSIYAKPILALLGSLIFLLLYWVGIFFVAKRTTRNILVTLSFGIGMMFLIACSNGITEIRYAFFILIFLLTLYHNISLMHFAMSIAYLFVIICYTIAFDKQNPFYEIITTYLLEKQAVTVERFVIAVVIILATHLLSLFLTYLYKERTHKQIYNAIYQDQQLKFLSANQDFADEIAAGKFETVYQIEEGDILGQSLVNMRDNLKNATERDIQEKFVSNGISEISEILRKNSNNLELLGDILLSKIINYLGASQGSFYVVEKQGENQEVLLRMIACYAYSRKKFINSTLDEGEGLVGQCYLEKKIIYHTKISPQYFKIRSSLGEILPSTLIVTPLMASQSVVGVLEIASLNPLQDYQRKFLEKVSEDIAITLISVKANEETKKLYQQSRLAAEELQAREEEMRQNVEELAATQEEMKKTQAYLEQTKLKSEAFIQGSSSGIISFNENGIIDEYNNSFLNTFQYEKENMKNINIITFLPDINIFDFDKHIKKTLFTQGRKKNGGFINLRMYVNKADIGGKKMYLAYIRDITEDKQKENDYTSKIKQLEEQIKQLTNNE
ncbi:MAG: PAS domain S-box protein [Bacteroidetes bacterium]|nr:MAG: PAS domain S-box protein [Bacteroidota bacterium]TAG89778.1 MAG: PAS domain S-box protein [Bacteroidota bacterium]